MLPRIVISQRMGRIDVQAEPARFERKADQTQLNMSGNGKVRVNLQTTSPKISIDQTAAFASVGLKKVTQLSMDFYSASFQKGLQNISTIAQEGLEFLQIERPGNVVANQAKRIGTEEVQLTVAAMPSVGPEITFHPGNIDVEVLDDSVSIQWQSTEGEFAYVPYSVNISMAQYPEIEISVEPGKEFVFYTTNGEGMNVDQAV